MTPIEAYRKREWETKWRPILHDSAIVAAWAVAFFSVFAIAAMLFPWSRVP